MIRLVLIKIERICQSKRGIEGNDLTEKLHTTSSMTEDA